MHALRHSIALTTIALLSLISGASAHRIKTTRSNRNDMRTNSSGTEPRVENGPISYPSLSYGPILSKALGPEAARVRRAKSSRLFQAALSKYERGDYEGMKTDCLSAIALDDTDPTVHLYLGLAYQSLGQMEDARHQLETAKWMQARVKPKYSFDQLYGSPRNVRNGRRRQVPATGDFGSNEQHFVPGKGLSEKGKY